jgi:hypothetical protein
MTEKVVRKRKIVEFHNDNYTYLDENNQEKTGCYIEATQREVVLMLAKSNGKSIESMANLFGKFKQALSTTLLRDNIDYDEFCKIYEFCTGELFSSRCEFIDLSEGVYDTLKLKEIVEIFRIDKIPFIVSFGGYNYKIVASDR